MRVTALSGSRATPQHLLGRSGCSRLVLARPPRCTPAFRPGSRRAFVQVQSSADGLLKKLTSWLPDPQAAKRKTLLERFFASLDASASDELLDAGFQFQDGARTYSRAEWKALVGDIKKALPDFKWTAATDGIAADDGWAVVLVQMTGHHTGAPYQLPGSDLPPVAPSGRRISLEEGAMKVLVQGDKLKAISVIPQTGAGALALYRAVAGEEVGGRAAPSRASYADDA